MRRRTVLATLGTALVGAAAGCGGRGEGSSGTSPPTSEPSGPGASPAATPSPTDEETPTATATDAPTAGGVGIQTTTDEPTHGLDERFVVEARQSVAYTFHRFARAERLGPIGREPDQGSFLVVECTVENAASAPMTVPIEDIVLRGGVRLFARQDDTDAAAADRRVDLPPLTNETIFPGTPLRGVLAFDLPATEGNDYYLRITPPGEPETPVHRVTVGPLESLPELS